jgi:hypothetical protein
LPASQHRLSGKPPAHPGSTAKAKYAYPVVAEPFAGIAQTDVIAQAIKFWSDHLDAIDRRIAELQVS